MFRALVSVTVPRRALSARTRHARVPFTRLAYAPQVQIPRVDFRPFQAPPASRARHSSRVRPRTVNIQVGRRDRRFYHPSPSPPRRTTPSAHAFSRPFTFCFRFATLSFSTHPAPSPFRPLTSCLRLPPSTSFLLFCPSWAPISRPTRSRTASLNVLRH